jgi:DNA mismatch endonuclease, patch repair protein
MKAWKKRTFTIWNWTMSNITDRHKPIASSFSAKRRMELQRQKNTGPETRIRSVLHKIGLRYRIDYQPLGNFRRKVDIVFVKHKVAVFVDGCFWHGCPIHGTWPKSNPKFWREKIETNRKRDAQTTHVLIEAGWKVLRVWEHEPTDITIKKILALLPGNINKKYCKIF